MEPVRVWHHNRHVPRAADGWWGSREGRILPQHPHHAWSIAGTQYVFIELIWFRARKSVLSCLVSPRCLICEKGLFLALAPSWSGFEDKCEDVWTIKHTTHLWHFSWIQTALVGKAMISQLKTVCKPFPKWPQRMSVNLVSPLTHSWDCPLTTAFPTTGGTTVNGIEWESNANHVLPKLPAFGFLHYLFQMFSSALDICLKGYSIIFYWTKFVLT